MKNLLNKSKYWVLLFVIQVSLGTYLAEGKFFWRFMFSDGEGYMLYLPAVFIHGTFENIPVRTPQEYQPYQNTQKVMTRFTYGIAFLNLPFFLCAKLWRYAEKLPLNDAFAVEYSIAMLLAACFYATLGLYYLYKTLKIHFDNRTSVLTILILLFGTNLLFYIVNQANISHHYTFCLVSMLIYFTPILYKKPSIKYVAIVGFLIGLIFLIRSTNILIAVMALLYDVQNRAELRKRCSFLVENWGKLLLIPLICLLVYIPQMCYWYYLSGKLFVNAYLDENIIFYWTSPQFFNIFFGLCNGFFAYTPLMAFSLVGLVMASVKNILNARLTLIAFCLTAYMCASWWCWWFGGTFGYRSFTDYYPFLAFGLAFYLDFTFKFKNLSLKILNFTILFLLSFYSFRMVTSCYNFQVEADGRNSELFLPAVKRCFFVK